MAWWSSLGTSISQSTVCRARRCGRPEEPARAHPVPSRRVGARAGPFRGKPPAQARLHVSRLEGSCDGLNGPQDSSEGRQDAGRVMGGRLLSSDEGSRSCALQEAGGVRGGSGRRDPGGGRGVQHEQAVLALP